MEEASACFKSPYDGWLQAGSGRSCTPGCLPRTALPTKLAAAVAAYGTRASRSDSCRMASVAMEITLRRKQDGRGRVVVSVVRAVLSVVVAVLPEIELAKGNGDQLEGRLVSGGGPPDKIQQWPQARGKRPPLRVKPHQALGREDGKRHRRSFIDGG